MARRPSVLKVILCGEYGVGKSSIFRRFVYNSFIENADRKSTLGFDHYEKTFKLQLWDTGGLERVASVTTSYFKYADGAILVFAYDGWESFSALSQHVIEIVASAEKAKIFLCGNKCDLLKELTVGGNTPVNENGPNDDDVGKFFDENRISDNENLFGQFFKISCKTNESVQSMFEQIAESLAKNWKAINLPRPDYFRLNNSVDQVRKNSDSCC
uniref:Uncharacterized protein n=1 Tax=Romanomermis culicivorax TaxID=13658 RepID=A0A915I9T9_ROMCU